MLFTKKQTLNFSLNHNLETSDSRTFEHKDLTKETLYHSQTVRASKICLLGKFFGILYKSKNLRLPGQVTYNLLEASDSKAR